MELSRTNCAWLLIFTVESEGFPFIDVSSFSLDQNKDGQINRKDMTKIIEAMYDLANEEDRTGEKSPDKRVDVIMQRLNKDKSGRKTRRCSEGERRCFFISI